MLQPPPTPTLFPYTTLFRSTRPTSRYPKGTSSSRPKRCASASRGSEEHMSELQSQSNLVCRLLLEKKKKRGSYGVLGVTANFLNMYDRSRKHLQPVVVEGEW